MSDEARSAPVLDTQTNGKRIAVTLLRHALGFRHCELPAIESLAAAGHVVQLSKGKTLVRQGDAFDSLCLIIEGALEVSVTQQDGQRRLFGYLQPGDIAGLMSLWDGLPHPNDMTARKATTRVLLVRGDKYRPLRDRYPSLARALEVQMAYRSRLMHERAAGDTSLPADVRLARLLHILVAFSGRRQSDGVQVTMTMSQSDIGNFLSLSRQRANFAMQVLKKDGLLLSRYSEVTIVDPIGLAKRAGL